MQKVPPTLYNKDYYLGDNEGYREYRQGLDQVMYEKYRLVLDIAAVKSGDTILDIGCGRGEIVYYCVQRGAKTLGIDYSPDAIGIAQETIDKLDESLRNNAKVCVADFTEYDFPDRYDTILMVEVFEHLYDWQIEKFIGKLKDILKDNGKLIITTPNYWYERYLYPAKRLINIPLNLLKLPKRMIKGKYRNKPLGGILSDVFKIFPHHNSLLHEMHVNVSSPAKIRKLFKGFRVHIQCKDYSQNPLSVLLQKRCGRQIIAVITL
ncbi:MAG: class I SAM-dependent methyltransferase [Candidatus Omnitrophica bacterium]|nr:class I SAM-dependent methyltransferase [Candidatus Omnitrophota bacterium]